MVQRRSEEAQQIAALLAPVFAAGGPTIVLQPIVALASGARVGAEALSRFPSSTPDVWFAEAHSIGRPSSWRWFAEDAATLLTLGVDYGQGWHFGRPGPASALTPSGNTYVHSGR